MSRAALAHPGEADARSESEESVEVEGSVVLQPGGGFYLPRVWGLELEDVVAQAPRVEPDPLPEERELIP